MRDGRPMRVLFTKRGYSPIGGSESLTYQFATRLAAVVGFERALQGTAKRRVQQAPSARAVPGLALQHRRRAQQCCSSAVRSTRETLWSLDS